MTKPRLFTKNALAKALAAANGKALVRAALGRMGLVLSRRQDPFNLAVYRALCAPADLARRPFYNVGAGAFHHPCWTNIDYVSEWYGGVQKQVVHHDLMSDDPLPIADGGAKIIYTSHTIEHIKESAVAKLFREAHRALEPGGLLRVTTGPDAETDYRALQRSDRDWFYWARAYEKPGTYEHIYTLPATRASLAELWVHHVASALCAIDKSPNPRKMGEAEIRAALDEKGFPAVLDYFCGLVSFDPQRPGNHVSWWSHGKTIDFLRAAGFQTVYRSGFNQSASPLLRNSPLFDATHPQISLYVEAVKS
jgi:predicted SAM-dependent methyltransferase